MSKSRRQEIEVIIDSSSLILLTKTSLLGFLLKLKMNPVISRTVYQEVVVEGIRGGYEDATFLEELVIKKKILVKKVFRSYFDNINQEFSLHRGECESIALTLQRKDIPIFCDDKKAINICKILGLRFLTSINFLEQLYLEKLINKKQTLGYLNKLECHGWYSEEIISQVRNKINGRKIS